MIPKECKRLAEVDFPIAEVSKHSAREKSIRHGHPSTLHLWWARRPLASCRAMLLALLLPDPADERCPPEFKEKARSLLLQIRGKIGNNPQDLRKALLKFIGEFANWDLAADQSYLKIGRELVKAAYGKESPLVVDPFAGGGSIPLEALRLNCETFASDLNPVACLILKAMIEDIPRHGCGLADELYRAGTEANRSAEQELAQFYPTDPDEARPIAYLWARTVRCESPNCGAEIPLVRSFWLCKKTERMCALRYVVERTRSKGPILKFEIFQPTNVADVPRSPMSRSNATCLCCNMVLAAPRVRAKLIEQHGGADVVFDDQGNRIGGARLLAVVTVRDRQRGRSYRLATERDYTAVCAASQALAKMPKEAIPNEPLGRVPVPFGVINVWVYGMNHWSDLFTAREKLALSTLAGIVRGVQDKEIQDLLAIAVSKCADYGSALTHWHLTFQKVTCTFGRPAIPMSWDFVEPLPYGNSSGSIGAALDTAVAVLRRMNGVFAKAGQAQLADACSSPLPSESVTVWFTDPPYYDNVPYSYISDFFYVWLKRTIGDRYPTLFGSELTPKETEIVAYLDKNDDAQKARAKFEDRLAIAFAEGRRLLTENGICCVVFAHKTTEGWEALLSGMLSAGWTINGSWPLSTERPGRLRAQDSAALGSSIHLVCRPRVENKIGDWSQVLRELPKRVGDWMERLQNEGIRGADLVFACIEPALEIFSRYSKVETTEGRAVDLAEYLIKVWEVVGRTALEQILGTAEAKARNGAAGALEEDARLTALFLWTMQSTSTDAAAVEDDKEEETDDDDGEKGNNKKKKGLTLIFDVARRFAQPLGIHLPDWEGRIIETEKGVVRLLPVRERSMQLFGEDGVHGAASEIERGGDTQLVLFPEAREPVTPRIRGRRRAAGPTRSAKRDATILDRVHAAMLLQASGQANALRAMLEAEQERSPDFLRLANALSALYPKESEEKRLLDAMLLGIRK